MSQEISTFPQRLGAGRLRKLKDVSSAAATDGQALVYNAVTGHWEPQTITPDLSAIEADITQLQTDVTDVTGDLATHTANTSNPHSVTLAQTGNTVIDDTAIPATDTNTADVLLDNLANRIKAITGEAGWKDAPDTTLTVTAANMVTVAAHIADTANPHAVTFAQVSSAQSAIASAGLALTTTITDIPGATITLPTAGTYFVWGTINISFDSLSSWLYFYMNVGGTDGTRYAYQDGADQEGVLTIFKRVVTVSSNVVVKLRGEEASSASSSVIQNNTEIAAIKVA